MGLYDGSVAVFDMRNNKTTKPIFASSVRTGKHSDPVWQVAWQPEVSAARPCPLADTPCDLPAPSFVSTDFAGAYPRAVWLRCPNALLSSLP